LAEVSSGTVREMPCGEGGVSALALTVDGRVIAGCGDGFVQDRVEECDDANTAIGRQLLVFGSRPLLLEYPDSSLYQNNIIALFYNVEETKELRK